MQSPLGRLCSEMHNNKHLIELNRTELNWIE